MAGQHFMEPPAHPVRQFIGGDELIARPVDIVGLTERVPPAFQACDHGLSARTIRHVSVPFPWSCSTVKLLTFPSAGTGRRLKEKGKKGGAHPRPPIARRQGHPKKTRSVHMKRDFVPFVRATCRGE
jgi:hypothetical protein